MSTKRQRAGWIDKQLENFNMRRGRRGKAIWAYFNRYKELFYDNNTADKKLIGTGFAAECKYCFTSLCANPTTLVYHIIRICESAPVDAQTAVIAIRREERVKRQKTQETTTSVPLLSLPNVNNNPESNNTRSRPAIPSEMPSPNASPSPQPVPHAPPPSTCTTAPIDQQQCQRLDFYYPNG